VGRSELERGENKGKSQLPLLKRGEGGKQSKTEKETEIRDVAAATKNKLLDGQDRRKFYRPIGEREKKVLRGKPARGEESKERTSIMKGKKRTLQKNRTTRKPKPTDAAGAQKKKWPTPGGESQMGFTRKITALCRRLGGGTPFEVPWGGNKNAGSQGTGGQITRSRATEEGSQVERDCPEQNKYAKDPLV